MNNKFLNNTRYYYSPQLIEPIRKDKAIKDFKKVLKLNDDDGELSQKAKQQLQELGIK